MKIMNRHVLGPHPGNRSRRQHPRRVHQHPVDTSDLRLGNLTQPHPRVRLQTGCHGESAQRVDRPVDQDEVLPAPAALLEHAHGSVEQVLGGLHAGTSEEAWRSRSASTCSSTYIVEAYQVARQSSSRPLACSARSSSVDMVRALSNMMSSSGFSTAGSPPPMCWVTVVIRSTWFLSLMDLVGGSDGPGRRMAGPANVRSAAEQSGEALLAGLPQLRAGTGLGLAGGDGLRLPPVELVVDAALLLGGQPDAAVLGVVPVRALLGVEHGDLLKDSGGCSRRGFRYRASGDYRLG